MSKKKRKKQANGESRTANGGKGKWPASSPEQVNPLDGLVLREGEGTEGTNRESTQLDANPSQPETAYSLSAPGGEGRGEVALPPSPNQKSKIENQKSLTADSADKKPATSHSEPPSSSPPFAIRHSPFTSDGRPLSDALIYQNASHGIWLYNANCLAVLDAIAAKYPDGRFDMIFADPPYFLSNGGITCHAGKMVSVHKGDWDKSRGWEWNHEFNTEWLKRCQKVLKPNGTLWVTGTHHVIFSVGFAMQQLGFKILNDIAWEKPNPPPNLSCRYFTHSTETILWAAKNEKSKHTFNYEAMKAVTGKQMKTVWRFPAPGNAEKTHGKHPTQKPLALVERCILASTDASGLVLDPFMGWGYNCSCMCENRSSRRRSRTRSRAHQTCCQKDQSGSRKALRSLFARPTSGSGRCTMKAGGVGGGRTITGLDFEKDVDFQHLLAAKPGYELKEIPGKAGVGVFFKGEFVARCFRKHTFYKFLAENGIAWKEILSKQLLPDEALLVIVRETLFIIEVKYQQVDGSVDEKLQTCDFKRKQYQKLVASLELKVEYVYVLNDWFRDPRYKDVLDYIHSVNCHYKFGCLPLAWLGLPEPQ